MAPTTPKRSLSSSIRKSTASNPSENKVSGIKSAFGSSKREKRLSKRSSLLSRIEKSKPLAKKQRRPSKKLVTTLQSLASALPEISNDRSGETVLENARIKHRSLKSRPGASKKKESLITLEKERFNKNMAQMVASPGGNDDVIRGMENTTTQGDVKERWATIRSFIKQNLEQRVDPEAGKLTK